MHIDFDMTKKAGAKAIRVWVAAATAGDLRYEEVAALERAIRLEQTIDGTALRAEILADLHAQVWAVYEPMAAVLWERMGGRGAIDGGAIDGDAYLE